MGGGGAFGGGILALFASRYGPWLSGGCASQARRTSLELNQRCPSFAAHTRSLPQLHGSIVVMLSSLAPSSGLPAISFLSPLVVLQPDLLLFVPIRMNLV